MLQAVADANAMFLSVDIGDYGKHSDGGVLKNSSFGRALFCNQLPIPKAEPFMDDGPLPYYFLGDEAYPLRTDLLRPYPGRALTPDRRIHNYRHSRGRRIIECAFGIMTWKWAVLRGPLHMSPENATHVALACCVLHNYVRRREGTGVVTDTQGQQEPCLEVSQSTEIVNSSTGRPSQAAMAVRDRLCNIFVHKLPLEWQNKQAHVH